MKTQITPFLMFEGRAEEAIGFYVSLFDDAHAAMNVNRNVVPRGNDFAVLAFGRVERGAHVGIGAHEHHQRIGLRPDRGPLRIGAREMRDQPAVRRGFVFEQHRHVACEKFTVVPGHERAEPRGANRCTNGAWIGLAEMRRNVHAGPLCPRACCAMPAAMRHERGRLNRISPTMRAVVQRVTSAAVTIDGTVAGAIERGLVVLLGVAVDDTDADVVQMADKLAGLRIFADGTGAMNRSVSETGGAFLVISQFTLLGDTRKGRRPSFISAARGDEANARYEAVIARLRASGLQVETGRFGADMAVALVNDGPVTILIDTKKRF